MTDLRLIDSTAEPRPALQESGSGSGSGSGRWSRLPQYDRALLGGDARALLGGAVAVFLMIYWAVDDGGFDPGTWYWGALITLACVTATLGFARGWLPPLPRSLTVALVCFGLYVGWSYLSMTWAQYPGLALEGSNRALLYLLMFALLAALPWRRATALIVLGAFAVGIGAIAVAFLLRFALGDHIPGLFLEGRLVSPTGYFNSTAALYTIGALLSIALAARRGMPGALRGLLLALATADLQLAVTVQSRGWLFTLPMVALFCILLVGERLRTAVAAALPAAGTLVVIHPLLRVYEISQPGPLTHVAIHAGKLSLLSCAGVFAVGTLVAWIEVARGRPPLRPAVRRTLGTAGVVVAVACLGAGLLAVSNGHPGSFISRQWHGFTREPSATDSQTHFAQVGSGRYDIWKSALHAFEAHPIGGLGQDNFADYYLTHRNTYEEPEWTHSVELRLLTHTGAVGFLLFAGFLAAALTAALGARRRGDPAVRMLAGAALLPLVVWLVHGSIDWFWEIPALSGPALGFLAMAARLRTAELVTAPGAAPASERPDRPVGAIAHGRAPRPAGRIPRPAVLAVSAAALVAATIALGVPYLSVRELALGETASHTNVDASLADFTRAHRLNPLSSAPGLLGGTVAVINGRDADAQRRFAQALRAEPQQWVAWLGSGLAASAQHHVAQARRDYRMALRIDARQAVVRTAAARVGTRNPLTAAQAFQQIDYLP